MVYEFWDFKDFKSIQNYLKTYFLQNGIKKVEGKYKGKNMGSENLYSNGQISSEKFYLGWKEYWDEYEVIREPIFDKFYREWNKQGKLLREFEFSKGEVIRKSFLLIKIKKLKLYTLKNILIFSCDNVTFNLKADDFLKEFGVQPFSLHTNLKSKKIRFSFEDISSEWILNFAIKLEPEEDLFT